MDEKELKSIALIGAMNPDQNSATFSLSFVSGGNGIRLSSRPVFLEFLQINDFFFSNALGGIKGVDNASVFILFTPTTYALNDALSVSLDPGVNVQSSIQYLINRFDRFLRFEVPLLRVIQPDQRISTLAINVRPSALTAVDDYFQASIRLFWREL
jgi:hypothetical protein